MALCHCTETSLNKMYFKNRWAKPRGGSSGREGATVHPPFAFLQPACSALLGMCAASPFCLTAVCWCCRGSNTAQRNREQLPAATTASHALLCRQSVSSQAALLIWSSLCHHEIANTINISKLHLRMNFLPFSPSSSWFIGGEAHAVP